MSFICVVCQYVAIMFQCLFSPMLWLEDKAVDKINVLALFASSMLTNLVWFANKLCKHIMIMKYMIFG